MNTAATLPDAATQPHPVVRPNAWAIMTPVRWQIRLGMALSIGAVLSNLGAMATLALTVHALLERPGQWPWLAMLGVLGFTAASYVLRGTSFNQTHYAAFRLERILRIDLANRLSKVALGYVQSQGAAALAKVMYDDIKALHVFVADSPPLYARAYAAPLITLVALLWLDWRLALVALGVLAVGMGLLSAPMRRRQDMVRRYSDARERVNAAIVEFVQAMPVVRTFDTGRSTFGRYERALVDFHALLTDWYRRAGWAARCSLALLNPLPTLFAVMVAGVWLAQDANVATSRLVAVLLLCTGMAEAMMPVLMLMHMIDKVKLSAARIQEVLQAPVLAMIAAAPRPGAAPHDASVSFEQVSFRYAADDALALEEVSFCAAAGTVTALVGPSGAGKSTVAKLIPRFWDVNAGRVLVGGVDVRALSADALMQQVAFVFQDTFLFADSIAANIRLGAPNADDAAVEAAARAAQAHDFILALPQGYATNAGERGIFLSGGERQRITIARAILQNRPILVLDEATAFADPENEAALVAALSVLMRGKTVIIVAHRLSTIRDADQILVFDRGRLVERGGHDDLVAQGGVYARLWSSFETAQNWSLGHTRTKEMS